MFLSMLLICESLIDIAFVGDMTGLEEGVDAYGDPHVRVGLATRSVAQCDLLLVGRICSLNYEWGDSDADSNDGKRCD